MRAERGMLMNESGRMPVVIRTIKKSFTGMLSDMGCMMKMFMIELRITMSHALMIPCDG